MFGRIFSFLFYIFVAYLVFALIKLIFNMGRTAGEFSRRVDEAGRRSGGKKAENDHGVIELNRDQYKIE